MPRRVAGAGNITATAGAATTAVSAHATTVAPRININSASREELEQLPGIGAGLAGRIVAHRERHGAFRRVEHLISVSGISERRFEQLRAHVTVD